MIGVSRIVEAHGAPLDAVVVGVVSTRAAASLSGVSAPTRAEGRFDVPAEHYAIVPPSSIDTLRVHVRA